jgi:uncharacterized protein (TIGR02453 family)
MPVTAELFRYLGQLRQHNERDWFNANKERYQSQVRDPVLALITTIAPKLAAISRHLVADPRPSGGSMLRIYRDTRFSADKKPYKTNVGVWFALEADKDAEAPGYYLHLEPGHVFMAAGMWHPGGDALRAIREAIVADPRGWKRAARSGLGHGETALKRAPRGFPPDHPLIEDVKRTSFTVGATLTERQACAPRFPALVVDFCRREAPLVKFLAQALRLRF